MTSPLGGWNEGMSKARAVEDIKKLQVQDISPVMKRDSHWWDSQEDSVINEFIQGRRNLKSSEKNWQGHQEHNVWESSGDFKNVHCFSEIMKVAFQTEL